MARSKPEIVAGCRMPSDAGITAADRATYEAARAGSAQLLAAILKMFERQKGLSRG